MLYYRVVVYILYDELEILVIKWILVVIGLINYHRISCRNVFA